MYGFEVLKSELFSTQVFPSLNKIEGEFRAARIHDQTIAWGSSTNNPAMEIFDILTLNAGCTCKYQ